MSYAQISTTQETTSKTSFVSAFGTLKAKPTTEKNVSTRAYALVLQGHSNSEMFSILAKEYGLGKDRKSYPAWYRVKLTNSGVMVGEFAPYASKSKDADGTQDASMSSTSASVSLSGTLAEQVAKCSLLVKHLQEKIVEQETQLKALTLANTAFIKAVNGKADMQTPISAQLTTLAASTASMQEQLKTASMQETALTAALAAYNAALAV